MNVILILFILLCVNTDDARGADCEVDASNVNTDKVSSKSNNDDSSHPSGGGGLRWQDLGVSLEECPLTTALMLDKYNSNHGNYQNSNTNNNNQHCLDDSVWLLHPSSGFVENGSLCGIIGPSG